MQADRPLIILDEARAHVQNAAIQWDATSPERVFACQSALNHAVGTLQSLLPLASGTSQDTRLRLRSGVAALKQHLYRLERLLDSASAFLRIVHGASAGLALYAADGRLRSEKEQSSGVQG